MALDQVHEQNNDLIKGVGGATRFIIREDESALLRWELCGSELAHMMESFKEVMHNSESEITVSISAIVHGSNTNSSYVQY